MPVRTNLTNQPPTKHPVLCCGGVALLFLAIAGLGFPQPVQAAEVEGQGEWVTLRGNTRPEAKAINDRGRVSDGLMLDHMMLQLQRSSEQEQALQQFIKDIHDPASPLFHHWITAAEFGERYGAAPASIAKVTDWLESQGFKVNLVYPNQMVIDFSGSAGQIRRALRTEIHNLQVNGHAHIANMSDPQIPAGLASTVAGVVSLNDFRPHPTLHPRANYTAADGYYLIAPADLATIYNFNPAFRAGISGQGQTIVLIEDTDVYSTADWNTFRSTFGLASAYPQGSLTQIHPASSPTNNCTDPGHNFDDIEATLDVEWASAAAPSAAIVLASCTDTTNFGGFIALENLLNASGTPPAIVSISYGESESYQGASYNAYISSLYEQGVAEGVSIFVSSGDEGAASSDADESYAVSGVTVSGFTSTAYNVSVGGTDFADTYQGSKATYWNFANTSTYGSALSYVPEIPWNDSCASVLLGDYLSTLPTYGSGGMCGREMFLTTASGSGGPSGCASGAPDTPGVVSGTCAGFPKPAWQSGFIGNPNDGVRDIPDVSLFSANGVWGHYYVFCFSDPLYGYSCSGAPDTWAGAGGTSFAAPIMAAVQSLVNQASGSRWGNPNPSYYSLAATEYGSEGSSSCNSALGNATASNCIFYDVTPLRLLYTGTGTGGDIDVPCIGVNCYAPSGTYGVLSTGPQALSSVSVTNLGYGYTSAPTCTLSGGGGSGAACRASMSGVVSSISLTNGGSGFTYYPVTCTLSGGGGTGATCAAYICSNNEICYVYLTSFGSGYTSNPTCTLSGGGGTGATCTAAKGLGIATSLTSAGSGYTTMPLCTLSGGGGSEGTCAALAVNTSDGYQPAFGAAPGWDFATGIGTVNVSNLVASFGASAAAFSTSSLAFSPQPLYTSSAAESVTVTNTGNANLSISMVGIGGANAGDFGKSADTCTGATVTPNGTCSVSVTFTPLAAGSLGASLIFTDLAPHSPQTLALSGTGASVGVALSPSSLTFPDQATGSSSPAETVTLTNTGSVSLTLSSIAITGNNHGDFSQTHTCGSILGVGAKCAIQVTFAPAASGSRSAVLTIADNVLGSPQAVGLAGTGAIPVPFVNQPLVPTSATPGGPGFTLTVNGTGFASGATVIWNGVGLATTFVSGEKLTATVPAANIASAGKASISVGYSGSTLSSNVVLFLVTPPATNVAFANASGSPITVGSFPRAIAVGDFTGDGKLDLAVANAGSNSLTILLGNGNGTFTPVASSPNTGGVSDSIAVGDFNGDGKLDLAVLNAGEENVTILLGNGDGTFTPASSSPSTGPAPYSIVMGDFNGEGILDFALANAGSNNLTILLGNGDGTFTPAASPTTGTDPLAVAVGDFNGDGKLDLAVANGDSDTVTILLGNGDGTFTPAAASPATGVLPMAIVAGDFNGDGKLDLAVANDSSTLTILLGNGDGTFTPAAASPATGVWPIAIAVGDFDGDGKLDLAVVNVNNNNLTILLGNGDGTFTPAATSPSTGTGPMAVAVGDFNGDGRLDLATANYETNNVSVLLQSPPVPVAGVSATSLTFSNQGLGTNSATQPVTLSNTGDTALTIASITTSGDFSQTNTCGSSVTAGANCTISVAFAPTATGTRSGTLTITDNSNLAAGSTQTASLKGTGIDPVPGISSLSPASATAGAAAQTLTINGTKFLSTSAVTYNSVVHTPTLLSSTQLTIPLSTSDQATAGTYAVVVTNPAPGGGASNSVNFTVNKATPVITWATPAAITYGTALSATQLDASSTVAGTFAYNPAAGTTPAAGTDTLSVTLTPTNTTDYTTATQTVSLIVNKATPTITWATPAAITYGTALSATQLDATSTVAGTFAYNPAAGTTPAAGTDTLSVTFTPTNTTDYTTATQTVSLIVNKATPTITWATPAAITYGTALSATQLDASSTVAGTFAYNPAAGTTPAVGTDTLSVTLTPTNTTDYTTATQTVSLTVNNGVPTITSLSPTSATAGAAAETLTINGTKFLSISKVTYNGIAHTPTFVSSTQLKITLSTSDQATAGIFAVVVTNPAPGGGASNSVNFTVNSPVAGISPTSLTFGNENLGLTSASQSVTLSNTGKAALTIAGIAASANFAETNTCGSSLAAGGSCAISVTFSPTATGSLTGSLTITDNNKGVAGSKQTVSLKGTGLAAIAVTLTPASASVALNGTQVFTATISNSTNTALNWYVNGVLNGNSTQGTLTGAGLTRTYKAPPVNVPSPNPAVIEVVSAADPTKTNTASMTVTDTITVNLSPASASVALSGTQVFTATISNSTNIALNWYVNGVLNGNSTQGTLTGTGLTRTYKAPPVNVPRPNPAVIKVVSAADPAKSETASMTVQ